MNDSRSRGAVFTPPAIGRKLAEVALAGVRSPSTVCDPASGDGRLLAQVKALAGSQTHFFGADIYHPKWLDDPGDTSIMDQCDFYHGNALLAGLGAWPGAPSDGFDLVIGNPPFRNQLERRTLLDSTEREALKERFGEVATLYTDTSSMFLVHATQITAPGGRIVMIMPLSFLTTRDARPARRRVLELADLVGIWVANSHVFPNALVQVCAVVLDRKTVARDTNQVASWQVADDVNQQLAHVVAPSDERQGWVQRWSGEQWRHEAPVLIDQKSLGEGATWGHLVADLVHDTPQQELTTTERLSSLVSATAGFRRQFYGLAPHVFESSPRLLGQPTGLWRHRHLPVVTSGLIEPGRVLWGQRTTRIAGTVWQAPAIAEGALADDESLERWLRARLVPKVVLATQTPVLEAAIDVLGHWVPSTPVIAVHTAEENLWHVLAVLLSPPISVWAASTYVGAALSAKAIKVSASQVEDAPLPPDRDQWNLAAEVLANAYEPHRAACRMLAVVDAAKIMTQAYAASSQVFEWWHGRMSPKLDG